LWSQESAEQAIQSDIGMEFEPKWALIVCFSQEVRMKVLKALSVAMLLFGVAALADQPTRASQDRSMSSAAAKFKALDRNGDGELSKLEARSDSSISAQFASFDLNLNGYITKSEYDAYIRSKTQPSGSEPATQS
jgi:hypothetical protein